MVCESSHYGPTFLPDGVESCSVNPFPAPDSGFQRAGSHPEHPGNAATLPSRLPLETGCLALMSELSWPSLRMNAIRF